MEHISAIKQQALDFLASPDFFFYHGVVLALLWFVIANIAILLRKVSTTLHGFVFFFVDVTTVLFTAGALSRVYPHIDTFSTWSLVKQGHVAFGAVFIVLVLIQHFGGVVTLLKNQTFNPAHRKFAVVVTNSGRLISVFGMILSEWDQRIIIGSSVIALLLLVASVYKVFIAPNVKTASKPAQKAVNRESNRQKSPKRD